MNTADAAAIARDRALGMSDATIAARLAIEGRSEPEIRASLVTPVPLIPELTATPHVPVPAPASPARFPAPLPPRERSALIQPLVVGTLTLAVVAIVWVGASYILRPPVVYSISIPHPATSTPISYGVMPALSDPDYYRRVKDQFIEGGASFVDADLFTMRLKVYKEGVLALEVPILAKGKKGSWWETPVGVYKIETKEKNHFSSFGHVNMPYSMEFDGNFFIHGWPSYEDGTPVSSSYSGGCIRLSNEDAQKVYDLATIAMPVIVYTTEDLRDDYRYNVQGPKVPASSYLVADVRNGTILFDKNATSTRPIASITKLITALVVIENFNLDSSITITKDMQVSTTLQRLKAGQSYTVHDLLIVMLTESSNEAAEAFATHYGRGRFISLMNSKAASIGMRHSTFSDPAGFDVANQSSPEDIFTLLKYIYENRRFIFDISSDSLEHDAYGEVVFGKLENFNFIPGARNAFVGGKIGKTDEARETYAGVFLFDDRPVAVIALGSPDVQKDIATLLRTLNSSYAQ